MVAVKSKNIKFKLEIHFQHLKQLKQFIKHFRVPNIAKIKINMNTKPRVRNTTVSMVFSRLAYAMPYDPQINAIARQTKPKHMTIFFLFH